MPGKCTIMGKEYIFYKEFVYSLIMGIYFTFVPLVRNFRFRNDSSSLILRSAECCKRRLYIELEPIIDRASQHIWTTLKIIFLANEFKLYS